VDTHPATYLDLELVCGVTGIQDADIILFIVHVINSSFTYEQIKSGHLIKN
jgi:hypothetical protein